MDIDQFRSALKVKPFRPFVINMTSGEKHSVVHPEAVWQSPSGKTVLVHVKEVYTGPSGAGPNPHYGQCDVKKAGDSVTITVGGSVIATPAAEMVR